MIVPVDILHMACDKLHALMDDIKDGAKKEDLTLSVLDILDDIGNYEKSLQDLYLED